jgi:hypothetical protein
MNRTFILVLLPVLMTFACQKDPQIPTEIEVNSINLRFYEQTELQTIQDKEKAIHWYLSYLGAQINEENLKWNGDTFVLDLNILNLDNRPKKSLEQLIKLFKDSQEYKSNNFIFIGRFVMQSLNNSHHYYQIVDIPPTFKEFKAYYEFEVSGAIVESAVSTTERRIYFYLAENGRIASIAEELDFGGLIQSAPKVKEFEVFDIMPNGQFRYAIYDKDGYLKPWADDNFTMAGKPSKCMWCHEVNVQPAYSAFTNVPGYNSLFQFDSLIDLSNERLKMYREGIDDEIDYGALVDHEFMEIMYSEFMEPSLNMVAEELNLDTTNVKPLLNNFETHNNTEYGWLKRYNRSEIDLLQSEKVMFVPAKSRDASSFEPYYLQ